jgi:imidazolonepropionase-like amidohydrolase
MKLPLASVLLAACGSAEPAGLQPDPGPIPAATSIAFIDVTVLPMDAERRLEHHTVVVRDGRIILLGPVATVQHPADAVLIDGRGRFLMPGLADMHVHMSRSDAPVYVRHGITTVRNMWGFGNLAAIDSDIRADRLVGPTIHSVSSGLDGTPPKWPETRLVLQAADADAAVAEQAARGWTTLKMYQDLLPEVYDAIVDAARRRNMEFVGHVPHRVGLTRVLAAGQRSIEHLGGIEEIVSVTGGRGAASWRAIDGARIPQVVAMLHASGTWGSPTQVIFVAIAQQFSAAERDAIIQNRRIMLKALFDGGVPLLAGSDAGIEVTAPGSSLHDELRDWVAAGLTPYQALRAATTKAARFLREENEFGRIAVGMRADLLLLRADPLRDVTATTSIDGVVLRGAWLPNREQD